MLEIISTIPAHLQELAFNMREADKKEVMGFGVTPIQALDLSYNGSLYSKTALINDKVAACWGCAGIFLGYSAKPWLLTSDEVYKISPIRFARIYKEEVFQMSELFLRLENYVDCEYTAAIRLLEISGFKISEPEPIGKAGKLYRKFILEV